MTIELALDECPEDVLWRPVHEASILHVEGIGPDAVDDAAVHGRLAVEQLQHGVPGEELGHLAYQVHTRVTDVV